MLPLNLKAMTMYSNYHSTVCVYFGFQEHYCTSSRTWAQTIRPMSIKFRNYSNREFVLSSLNEYKRCNTTGSRFMSPQCPE